MAIQGCGIEAIDLGDGVEPDTTPSADVVAGRPSLMVAPTQVDFVAVPAGTSQQRAITLLNTGSADLHIDRFVLSGHDGFAVTIDGDTYAISAETSTGIMLAPAASVDITVRYTASDTTPAQGELVLDSDDPSSPHGLIVPLTANVSGACLSVSPTKVDLGAPPLGSTRSLPIRLGSCGDRDLVIDALTLRDGTDWRWAGDFTLPMTLHPNASAEVMVSFTASSPTSGSDVLTVHNNSFLSAVPVDLNAFVAPLECPTAVITCVEVGDGGDVAPETTLHCSASSSSGMAPVSEYRWTLTQPNGSVAIFRPSSVARDVTLSLDVVGTYRLSLVVADQDGTQSCGPAELEVLVAAAEAWRVEVIGRTPGRVGSLQPDLDVHLRHADAVGWFDALLDAWAGNPHPSWDADGDNDDPEVGAEVGLVEGVHVAAPAADSLYTLGVHYRDDDGAGPAWVTARVYRRGNLVFDQEVRLVAGDLWQVCTFGASQLTPESVALPPSILPDVIAPMR